MVGDQEDLQIWRRSRNEWVRKAFEAISTTRGAGLAREFQQAATVSRPLVSSHLALPGELTTLRHALDFLEPLTRADEPVLQTH
jgi:hypothetical protein